MTTHNPQWISRALGLAGGTIPSPNPFPKRSPTPPPTGPSPSFPRRSNAAVSVLLGQRWREMPTTEKAGFVSAAKRIKEDFHLQHPDAKTRCVQRKGKRAKRVATNDNAGELNI